MGTIRIIDNATPALNEVSLYFKLKAGSLIVADDNGATFVAKLQGLGRDKEIGDADLADADFVNLTDTAGTDIELTESKRSVTVNSDGVYALKFTTAASGAIYVVAHNPE